MIRIQPVLGGQVKGNRESALALGEERPDTQVRLLALATPEYWPMTQRRSRYIPGSTPRVNGGSPGNPSWLR